MKSSDPVGHNVRMTGFVNPGMNQVIAANGQLDGQARRRASAP